MGESSAHRTTDALIVNWHAAGSSRKAGCHTDILIWTARGCGSAASGVGCSHTIPGRDHCGCRSPGTAILPETRLVQLGGAPALRETTGSFVTGWPSDGVRAPGEAAADRRDDAAARASATLFQRQMRRRVCLAWCRDRRHPREWSASPALRPLGVFRRVGTWLRRKPQRSSPTVAAFRKALPGPAPGT